MGIDVESERGICPSLFVKMSDFSQIGSRNTTEVGGVHHMNAETEDFYRGIFLSASRLVFTQSVCPHPPHLKPVATRYI